MVRELYILDTNFNTLAVIENYCSLIWNERYYEPGDFELELPASSEAIIYMASGNYLWSADSEKIMIIENYTTKNDTDKGNTILYSGRSLESILDRRIVWTQTTVSGKIEACIKQLINENIIEPSVSDRAIPNFIFEDSTDTRIDEITINETQFTGNNMLEVIKTICEVSKVGFKIYLDTENKFVFTLYLGQDRSSSQIVNPQIEFSPNNDNLISSITRIESQNYKNVALVAGEGEGTARKTNTYGTETGLNRRELFVDARDISSDDGEGGTISPASYNTLLEERGKQKLAEYEIKKETDSDVETSEYSMYEFGVDYFLGDIVENVDFFDVRSRSRIVEVTTSITSSEISMHPIFSVEEIV